MKTTQNTVLILLLTLTSANFVPVLASEGLKFEEYEPAKQDTTSIDSSVSTGLEQALHQSQTDPSISSNLSQTEETMGLESGSIISLDKAEESPSEEQEESEEISASTQTKTPATTESTANEQSLKSFFQAVYALFVRLINSLKIAPSELKQQAQNFATTANSIQQEFKKAETRLANGEITKEQFMQGTLYSFGQLFESANEVMSTLDPENEKQWWKLVADINTSLNQFVEDIQFLDRINRVTRINYSILGDYVRQLRPGSDNQKLINSLKSFTFTTFNPDPTKTGPTLQAQPFNSFKS